MIRTNGGPGLRRGSAMLLVPYLFVLGLAVARAPAAVASGDAVSVHVQSARPPLVRTAASPIGPAFLHTAELRVPDGPLLRAEPIAELRAGAPLPVQPLSANQSRAPPTER